MLLSEDHLAAKDAVRAYAQDRIAPHAARWDKEHHFSAVERKRLAALGCYGVVVSTEHDSAGWTTWRWAFIIGEIAAGDGATPTVVSVNNCPVCSILMAWANEAQRQQ